MADNAPFIRAYIESANDERIGGFTIPLPVTKETLRPWLEAIEADSFHEAAIVIREIRASPAALEEVLEDYLQQDTPIAFDELNYLAAKIQDLRSWQVETFAAAVDAGLHCADMKDLINLARNVVNYEHMPAYSEKQYGEFLVQMEKDNSQEIFERLEKSEDPEERSFARYILNLEEHVDLRAYGRSTAAEEKGVFTQYGYITERAPFQEVYRGPEDIPREYRIFSGPAPLLLVEEADSRLDG